MTGRYDPRGGLYVGGEDFGLPAAAPPPLADGDLEELVRFEHPAKFLAVHELPGAAAMGDDEVASAYGADAHTVRGLRSSFAHRAEETARALLAEPELRAAARALPISRGGTLIALGDSITDDYLSWAEILRHCLAIARPDDRLVFANAGVSGDTTADVRRRLYGVVRTSPDLVVTMLGTNDCQRHGPGRHRLVDPDETRRNLRAIAGWLRWAGARTAWITPPPVLEAALAASVGGRPFELRDADVRAVARLVHDLGDPVVDLHEVLGSPPDADLLMADGVHPSPAGQARVAAAVLRMLAHSESGTGNP